MVRHMKRNDARSTRDIVHDFAKSVLALSASRTGASTTTSINKDIKGIFLRPFKVASGKIGVTKGGSVWVNKSSWGSKSWVRLNQNGKLNQVGEVIRTGKHRPGSKVNLGSKNIAEINSMMEYAKKFKKKETDYRKKTRGTSKAAWYKLLSNLDLPIPQGAPGYALTAMKNMNGKLQSALSASKRLLSKDDYRINISNKVDSCLNNHAGGIKAFARSFNGKIKSFETALSKRTKTHALKGATQNGFTVR